MQTPLPGLFKSALLSTRHDMGVGMDSELNPSYENRTLQFQFQAF